LQLINLYKSVQHRISAMAASSKKITLTCYFKKELPSDIFTNLNTAIVRQYNRDWKEIVKGEKLLPQFHREMPMPIKGRSIKELKKWRMRRITALRCLKFLSGHT